MASDAKNRLTLMVLPFVLIHIVAVAGIAVSGWSWSGFALAVAAYYLRMFGITAGFHRYFAHRAFKTSRWFQLVLALIGTMSVQKGVLWWAGHHRDHHRDSDTEHDIHSPRRRGFFWSHMGWFLCHRYDATPYDKIRDLSKYPELVWLNENYMAPQIAAAGLVYAVGGWHALLWIGMVSTTMLWHGTFTINSLAHVIGRQRYDAGDDSRNSFVLALITMGEGWHNNHHYFQSTANQGFFWWEIDLSYYILKALSSVGVVWDLRRPPARVLRGELQGPAAKLRARALAISETDDPMQRAA